MALWDEILDRTGAIGQRIMGYRQRAERDRIYMSRPSHIPLRSKIISKDGLTLVFDATTDLNASFPSKVTSFPVQDKSEITDHVINQNPTFSISGVVSDASANINTEKGVMSESEFKTHLLNLRDKREEVSIIVANGAGADKTYVDLIITNISFPRRTGDGVALFVDIDFEQIRKVPVDYTTVFVTPQPKTIGTTSGKTEVDCSVEKDVGKKSEIPPTIKSSAQGGTNTNIPESIRRPPTGGAVDSEGFTVKSRYEEYFDQGIQKVQDTIKSVSVGAN
jgi:hypothetical protein